MFTSLKRPAFVITAIIAVGAPSVASARFFDYGGTSPVPPAHVILPSPGPNPDEQIPWDRTPPWSHASHQGPGKQGHRYNRARGLHEQAHSRTQYFYDGSTLVSRPG